MDMNTAVDWVFMSVIPPVQRASLRDAPSNGVLPVPPFLVPPCWTV